MATARAVLQVFEEYQKARIKFVQTVAELAAKPQVRQLSQDFRVLPKREVLAAHLVGKRGIRIIQSHL
jgi:hypothetical protein